MIFISVDLPAPFSPMSAWTCPRFSRNDTSSSASTPGKALRTFETSSRYSAPGIAPLCLTISAVEGLIVAMTFLPTQFRRRASFSSDRLAFDPLAHADPEARREVARLRRSLDRQKAGE